MEFEFLGLGGELVACSGELHFCSSLNSYSEGTLLPYSSNFVSIAANSTLSGSDR